MIKKILPFLFLVCICFGFISCTKTNSLINEDTKDYEIKDKYYNSYTGLECSKDEINNPAFMVMVENSKSARPQSGLSYADVLYETSAEGGIPRFLALFCSNMPSTIGPIRSIRPYFLDIIKEFNLPFAHCGGSDEALNSVAADNSLISINEINQGSYFWRDSSRKAPHNLYTSADNIKKYISDKQIKITNSNFCSFDENFFNNSSLTSCSKINIKVNKTYNTSYEYRDNFYYKFMDSEKAVDNINNEQLAFSNIIIQKTPITLCNDNTHLNIPLIGEGDGFIFSKGKMINIKWKRESKNSKTILLDKDGNTVPLSPGKTMWNIVDPKSNIIMEN